MQIFTFADDTTLIGIITNRTIEGMCLHCLNGVVLNYMKLNVLKTKEMVFYFRRRKNAVSPLTINGQDIDNVQCFTFLGTTISATLKWDMKKSHQRLFLLKQLKKFGVSKVEMLNFYRAVIESVLTFSCTVWLGSSTVQQRSRICNIIRAASKSIGCDLPTIDEIYVSRLQKKRFNNPERPLTSSQTSLYASFSMQTP